MVKNHAIIMAEICLQKISPWLINIEIMPTIQAVCDPIYFHMLHTWNFHVMVSHLDDVNQQIGKPANRKSYIDPIWPASCESHPHFLPNPLTRKCTSENGKADWFWKYIFGLILEIKSEWRNHKTI